ncbi:MAG TPA: hypothetical protein VHC49_12575 [Mycobacteriales bacterium]|nr:hypothetical protein [Mycobacteriales bacterium]
MIVEGDIVRLREPAQGEALVPAGTEGYVVYANPQTIAVDVQVDGTPDHVLVHPDKVEFVRKSE